MFLVSSYLHLTGINPPFLLCLLARTNIQVMVFGTVPFTASSIESLFEAVGEGVVTIPENPPVSAELRDFLRRVLQPEWQDRISVRQLLVSPCFA